MSGIVFSSVHGQHDTLRVALTEARLPIDDLDAPGLLVCRLSDDRGLIGFVGLEGDGRDRLLRSLVILPSRRGAGYGRIIVERLETVVSGAVERLHLLTNGVAPFFRALGYVEAERADAPPVIAATAQFTSVCPASATYLVKDLV